MTITRTGDPFSPGNMPPGYTQGIAARSKYKFKAVAHVLVPEGGEYRTWCTSAPGMAENPLGGPCRQCVALVREYHEEYAEPPQACTCGTEDHPGYGLCRKPNPDCPGSRGHMTAERASASMPSASTSSTRRTGVRRSTGRPPPPGVRRPLAASTRDASWYDRPDVHSVKVFHIVTVDDTSACKPGPEFQRSMPLIDSYSDPATIYDDMRCRRPGCRVHWSTVPTHPR